MIRIKNLRTLPRERILLRVRRNLKKMRKIGVIKFKLTSKTDGKTMSKRAVKMK